MYSLGRVTLHKKSPLFPPVQDASLLSRTGVWDQRKGGKVACKTEKLKGESDFINENKLYLIRDNWGSYEHVT